MRSIYIYIYIYIYDISTLRVNQFSIFLTDFRNIYVKFHFKKNVQWEQSCSIRTNVTKLQDASPNSVIATKDHTSFPRVWQLWEINWYYSLNFSKIGRLAIVFYHDSNGCLICNFHSTHFEIFSSLFPGLCCEEWLTDTRHLTIYVLYIGGPSVYERCASSTAIRIQLWTEKVTTWLHFARPWIDLCVQNMLLRDGDLAHYSCFRSKDSVIPN
jgi:hypothetical protein